MAWHSMNQNIPWLRNNRDAVTSVHPGHHLFDVDLDGSLNIGKGYTFDEHVKPYLDMDIDVMPCIDVRVSSRDESQSAIFQGILQGDDDILARIRETAAVLAKLATEQNFSGFVVDYEPSFAYTLEHVEALMKFISILKEELSSVDTAEVEVTASGKVNNAKSMQKRRVGVCISNWGIIDVTRDDFAKCYQTRVENGGADFLMSMGYTYFPPEPGYEGFAELEKRCGLVSSLFEERATIGFGLAANDKRFENWFSLEDKAIPEFVRSISENDKVSSLSLWGRWYTEPEHKVDRFTAPLVEFLKSRVAPRDESSESTTLVAA